MSLLAERPDVSGFTAQKIQTIKETFDASVG